MSSQDQLLAGLSHANPVPDPDDPPTGAITGEAALHMIMASVQDDRVRLGRAGTPTSSLPQRQWHKSVSVAAASFIVILVILTVSTLVFGRSANPPTNTTATVPTTLITTTTTVTTTTEQATTTTTSQPTTTTSSEGELFVGLPKLRFGPLAPGAVAVEDGVTIPFAFTAPDITADFPLGLWVEQPGNPGVGIVPRDAIDPSGMIDYPDPVLIVAMSRSGDRFETVVADIIEEIPITSQKDITIGGRPAVQLDTAVVEGGFPIYSLGTQRSGEPIFGLNENQQHRFYIVDAPDGTLVVWLEIDPEAWNTLAPYWQQITESLRFP